MVQSLAISIPSISMNAATTLDSSSSPATSDSMNTNAYAEIPLTALSKTTRRQLSQLLNGKKILRSEEGYERDWRGMALLSKQKSYCDEGLLRGDDPIGKVLQLWCSNNPKTATFANLDRFLGVIDRWDVCDDIYENLAADAKKYTTQQQQKSKSLADVTDAANQSESNLKSDFGQGSDPNILTKDDVRRAQQGLPPQQYDAFVLFAEADIRYAVELLGRLEDNMEYNFKLCVKDRDLLAGVSFAHVALTQLIEERCKHLIVILTEEFMKSPENKFLVNYTQALQIEHKTRKIIPLLYEDSVVVPRTLKIYTHLKYKPNSMGLYDFWGKLAESIRNVNISTECVSTPASYTKDTYKLSSAPRYTSSDASVKASLANLPTPPADIPSININGHAFVPEDDAPKKAERNKYKKRSSVRQTTEQKMLSNGNGAMLRNAHSTSQLHTGGYQDKPNAGSMSNLSTTSGYSEVTKKKKKWPGKLFRKVFSRSSSKLQETA